MASNPNTATGQLLALNVGLRIITCASSSVELLQAEHPGAVLVDAREVLKDHAEPETNIVPGREKAAALVAAHPLNPGAPTTFIVFCDLGRVRSPTLACHLFMAYTHESATDVRAKLGDARNLFTENLSATHMGKVEAGIGYSGKRLRTKAGAK